MAKGLFKVQFLAKKEPNREKEKTKFHYGGLVLDEPIKDKLATDFEVVDFYTEEDFPVEVGKLYLCVLDIIGTANGQYLKFVSFEGEAPAKKV